MQQGPITPNNKIRSQYNDKPYRWISKGVIYIHRIRREHNLSRAYNWEQEFQAEPFTKKTIVFNT